jgi:rhodanese-related sulfurtransferase
MNSILPYRRGLMLAAAALVATAMLFAQGRPSPKVPELEVAQAKALIDAGAIVIDVRGQDQFDRRHLPSAVLLPLTVLQAQIPAWLAAAKDKPIVVYCNRGTTHGPEVTAFLQDAGFSRVANLATGIEGWAAAELPVIAGKG